ncbi:hypothetical protein M9Y10_031639 [Tritrichomonas musculus]|uniref:Uncharacterized protein n=1 Tax=Tritrichomonas musculus TaxID=1915356 RepID=A0ABR2H198_9EUKA
MQEKTTQKSTKKDELSISSEIMDTYHMILFILLIAILSYQFYMYINCLNYTSPMFFKSFTINKKVCWIFNQKAIYQVLTSYFSVIFNNKEQNFDFYFIIPHNMTLDLTNFTLFLQPGSNIIVKHYLENHTFMPYFSRARCPHNKIIIVKVFLHQILPTVDKILFLDTDMINVAPIKQLWQLNMDKRTIAASYRDRYAWINSGIVLYNLHYIRKQPKKLWECIFKARVCYVDDVWHTYCHNRSEVIILPYRYNYGIHILGEQFSQVGRYANEYKNVVFFHLQGNSKQFYSAENRSALANLPMVNGSIPILNALIRVYNIKETLDKKLAIQQKRYI